MADPELEMLRQAHEELARRVVEDRLAFSDRVQEVLDHAQHLQAAIDDRDGQVTSLREEIAALRGRVESLHEELVEAHLNHEALEQSRSFRYTAPLRRLGGTLRRH